jgi:tetratricopeptide (TPR) repeat protein
MHSVMDRTSAQPTLPPDDGGALYMSGLRALRNGDLGPAVSLLTQAIRRQPTHHGMRRNLVRALLAQENYQQVLAQADTALVGAPDDAELYFARGTALNALGQPSRACAAFARALSLQPDHAPSWLNMGNASADLDDLDSAETLYRTAIRLDAALPEAHASLGYLLTMQGRLPEAIAACETAIQLKPEFSQAHWNRAIALLLSGDFPRGFAAYEWRKRHNPFVKDLPDLPGPKWDGTGAAGRTILVRAEQGFGDAIQFVRYLCLIRDAGGTPVFACAPPLVPLIQGIPGVVAVAAGEKLPAYDAWIDQMSLPRLFGTTLDTVPDPGGYLRADPIRVETWRSRLPPGRKIGIAFAGNPRHNADRRRSIPSDLVVPLIGSPGLRFVNLQHGESARGLGLPDLSPWMTDYAETAALIANLDLVVTVDTSVAHLAGAMGKPVWIMLPFAPDWRWLLNRADSPWYRSARLFRQPAAGDWVSVLAEVMRELVLLQRDLDGLPRPSSWRPDRATA